MDGKSFSFGLATVLTVVIILLLLFRKGEVKAGDNYTLKSAVNEYKIDPFDYKSPPTKNRNRWAGDLICCGSNSASKINPTVVQIINRTVVPKYVPPVVNFAPAPKSRRAYRGTLIQ